jgi:hypothetical protein
MALFQRSIRALLPFARLVGASGCALVAGAALATPCGSGNYPFPFTDVAAVGDAFCPGIMQAYTTGVTKGTTATTFSPNEVVPRLQMTTFLQRSIDQDLSRIGRRAALGQWWTSRTRPALQAISVGNALHCTTDGKTVWSASNGNVVQIRASSGAVLGTWTGATSSRAVQVAAGKVYALGGASGAPGILYLIDPAAAPGPAVAAASNLGIDAQAIAFDGRRIWTANTSPGSVSIVTPQASVPYPVTTVATGFGTLSGIVFDGTNMWVTDQSTNPGRLLRLDANGGILQAVTVGPTPRGPVFDGINIWVPNAFSGSVTVVQASTGAVVATIASDALNKLNGPYAAAFDGQRVLVSNVNGNSVTMFKAADLSLIANVDLGPSVFPFAPCSDGINFFVPQANPNALMRL